MTHGRGQTTGGSDGNRYFLSARVPFAVCFAVLVFLMFTPTTCRASEGGTELGRMNLEDLMEIEISSASRKAESLSDAATAIFVIAPEDIRRSGATCIPELLRMVPGIEVAQIDANSWAITSRGFNGLFADKLLVLMDGRSVYTQLFGGVYWDVQDTLLEDIERIEVIRGPGATLWGVNAVNGVINIITRNSKDTIGGLVSAGAGSEERGFGTLRYGTKIGSSGFLRVYGKYLNRDDSILVSGERSSDGWDFLRGGFRFDVLPTDRDALTIQGDIYGGKEGGSIAPPTRIHHSAGSARRRPGSTEAISLCAWSEQYRAMKRSPYRFIMRE